MNPSDADLTLDPDQLDGPTITLGRPELMPPVRTQADLAATWKALMGNLGFSTSSIWLMALEVGGGHTGCVQVIEDMPDNPEPGEADHLVTFCREILSMLGLDGGSIAFLRSRPGAHPASAGDLVWAAEIARACSAYGVRTHAVHLATDEALTVISADDLIPR